MVWLLVVTTVVAYGPYAPIVCYGAVTCRALCIRYGHLAVAPTVYSTVTCCADCIRWGYLMCRLHSMVICCANCMIYLLVALTASRDYLLNSSISIRNLKYCHIYLRKIARIFMGHNAPPYARTDARFSGKLLRTPTH